MIRVMKAWQKSGGIKADTILVSHTRVFGSRRKVKSFFFLIPSDSGVYWNLLCFRIDRIKQTCFRLSLVRQLGQVQRQNLLDESNVFGIKPLSLCVTDGIRLEYMIWRMICHLKTRIVLFVASLYALSWFCVWHMARHEERGARGSDD